MTKDEFWEIIDRVNSRIDIKDKSAVLAETRKELSNLSLEDVLDWDLIFSEYTYLSNKQDLWCACAVMNSYYYDDEFEYFRYWLISQGKSVFMAALNDPDSLVNVNVERDEAAFEYYGYIGYEVEKEKRKRSNSKKILKSELSEEVLEEIRSEIPNVPDRATDLEYKTLKAVVPKLCRQHGLKKDMLYITM